MKKSILAAAATSTLALAAHAQSSVTLYGVLDAGVLYSNNQGGHHAWQQVSAATQNTVYGVKGTEDIGGGVHALFKLENGFNLNNGGMYNAGDAFGEQAYVGIQRDATGTLTVGRQFDPVNDYLGPLAAAGNGFGGNVAAHPFNNDNLAADSLSLNNTIKFTSASYHGLTFGGAYAFSNRANGFADNRAYGFGAAYAQGPLNLALAYLQLDRAGGGAAATNANGAVALADGSADFVAERQRIWGAGVSYAIGAGSVGALWTHSQIDAMTSVYGGAAGNLPLAGGLRMNNYELNAHYGLSTAWSVGGAYTFTDGRYGPGDSGATYSTRWHQGTLQTDYALSKRTDVYLEGIYQQVVGGAPGTPLATAMINTLSPSSSNRQWAITAGMRHTF